MCPAVGVRHDGRDYRWKDQVQHRRQIAVVVVEKGVKVGHEADGSGGVERAECLVPCLAGVLKTWSAMTTPARQAHSAQPQPQQPPQTPIVDADVILEHKENIKPLASGRRAAALADVFTPKSKEDRSARLAADRKRHMKECDNALDDDDPLAAFVRFVDWTVDNYPQGECVESGLLELLELATRSFVDSPLYKTDMRYLKLWILYASIVDHPTKIYAYLNANEIGTGYSLFYEEYCNALEQCGMYVLFYTCHRDETDDPIGVEKLQRCTTSVSPDGHIPSRGFKPGDAILISA
jgi:hypothetical protein